MLENPWAHLEEAKKKERGSDGGGGGNGNGNGSSVADDEGAADRPWH